MKLLRTLGAALLFAPALVLAAQHIVIENAGFAAPESIVHDERHDVYLLSNVNGRAIDNDGNGFISRIAPDGTVLVLKWIDGGAPGVTLHAPKGLAITGDTLYVADNGDAAGNVIRLFDLATGQPRGEIPIAGSLFLNGLTALPSGEVLATDSGWRLSNTTDEREPTASGTRQQADGSTWTPTGRDAIYRIGADRRVSVFARGKDLLQPNGIALLPSGNLLIASSSSPTLYELTPDGRRTQVRQLPDRGFDGVGQAPDGTVFAAGPEKLYRIRPDGQPEAVPGFDTHVADLHFDRKRNRLLLPLLRAHKVIIKPLPLP
ncbi:MAG: hypothetical protein LBO79_02695 [Zoogloeaceae bacterium]|nr:hypothetical protein [Zoogloeaceae bacterium]